MRILGPIALEGEIDEEARSRVAAWSAALRRIDKRLASHEIVVNAQGETRRPSLDDFFVVPEIDVQRENDLKSAEAVVALLLPPLAAGATSVHIREADKLSFDWPIADVAVVVERDDQGRCRRASVVLGAAAAAPRRARAAEDLLMGKAIDEPLARAAGEAALEGATPLAKNRYKLPIFAVLVRHALLRAVGQG